MQVKVVSGGLINENQGTVGGTQILLTREKRRLWLDMGIPPEALRGLKAPYETQLIPKLPPERLAEMGILPYADLKQGNSGTQNLLISHAHFDHYGLLNYADAFAKMNISFNVFGDDAFHAMFSRRQTVSRQAKKVVSSYNPSNLKQLDRDDWKVSAIPVEHSIDASFAYMVESREAKVGYTGDIRFSKGQGPEYLAGKLGGADVLITEATRTTSKAVFSEEDVVDRVGELMDRYSGLAVFLVGWYTFTQRIRSIIAGARGRDVVLFSQIAYLMEDILPIRKKNIYILKRKENPTGWEREFLDRNSNVVDFQWVNDHRDNVALVLPQIYRLMLFQDAPERDYVSVRPGDVVVSSLSEAYDEESFSGLQNLELYVNRDLALPLYNVHASGHARIDEIGDLIDMIRPRKVIVVHSPYPKVVKSVLRKYNPDNVVVPKKGQTVDV